MDERTPEELREEVAALRETVAHLRSRLLALVRLLPPDVLALVPEALAEGPVAPAASSPTDGWVETVELTPSDLPEELAALWRRTGRKDP